MNDLLERLPANFVLVTIKLAAEPMLKELTAPYVIVCLQECTRMNTLLDSMRKTLIELDKGLKGQLNMSQGMEDLATAFTLNQVPGRNPFSLVSWEKLAWWSNKGLQTWFADLLLRYQQLEDWVNADLKLPFSIWLPGLFNPTSFLTAVMQVTGRSNQYPLDKMTVITHVSTMSKPDAITEYPTDGAFVHGMCMQGARWAVGDDASDSTYTEGITECGGFIMDSRLKELLPMMPVVYVKAVLTKPHWEPSAVGYLQHDPNIYDCPVYVTSGRGPTYVFLATLTSKTAVSKWTLAAVALLMQDDD
jgi:dynein heavy chain